MPPEPSLTQARGTSASHKSRTAPSTTHGTRIEDDNVPSPLRKTESDAASSLEKPTQAMDIREEPSKPLDVPTKLSKEESVKSRDDYHIRSQSPEIMDTQSYYRHPPRMPLPIQEEIHTPGSPIIAPMGDGDIQTLQIDDLDDPDQEKLPRKTSALSAATADEVSEDEDELPIDKTKASVPVLFKWEEGGTKVYVTGSIFQWNRKAKLNPV